jgi:hypothetical protein
MADNFNFKQFLVENRLGAYAKAGSMEEGKDTTAHMMAKELLDSGMSPEEVKEELIVSARLSPAVAGQIIDDVTGQGLSADLEMDDDDFGGSDEPFGSMYEAGTLKVGKDGEEL